MKLFALEQPRLDYEGKPAKFDMTKKEIVKNMPARGVLFTFTAIRKM